MYENINYLRLGTLRHNTGHWFQLGIVRLLHEFYRIQYIGYSFQGNTVKSDAFKTENFKGHNIQGKDFKTK